MKQFLITLLFLPCLAVAQTLEPYQPFGEDAEEIQLYTYRGDYVALRVANEIQDPQTVEYLLSALDDGYLATIDHVGEEPRKFRRGMLDDLLSVAQVEPPCGFDNATACGFVGATGIELGDYRMEQMIDAAALGKIESTVFYEYSRNFFVFGDGFNFSNTDYRGGATRHFAHLLRFQIPNYIGLELGPDNTRIFNNNVDGILEEYTKNDSQCFFDTLRQVDGPEFFSPLESVLIGIYFELSRQYGQDFTLGMYNELRVLSDTVRRQIDADDLEAPVATQRSIDNFAIAASRAAGDNLLNVFRDEWKFPISRGAALELGVPTSTIPEDSSITCGLQNIGGLAGAFFNPNTSGEGFFVNVTSDDQLFIAWFGNGSNGEPLWLVSNVINIENLQWGDETTLAMGRSKGGDFRQPIQGVDPWGELTISWDNCNEARVTLEGEDGSKTQDLIRLADTKGISCNDLTNNKNAFRIEEPDMVILNGLPVGITYN
jgi:hypothetical protein